MERRVVTAMGTGSSYRAKEAERNSGVHGAEHQADEGGWRRAERAADPTAVCDANETQYRSHETSAIGPVQNGVGANHGTENSTRKVH